MRIPQSSNSPGLVKSTLIWQFLPRTTIKVQPFQVSLLYFPEKGQLRTVVLPDEILMSHKNNFPQNYEITKWQSWPLCAVGEVPLLGPSYAWQTSWLWFPGWRTSLQMLQGWANRQTAWASVWENNPLWTNQEVRAGLHQKTSFYPALLLETLWKSSNLAFLISEGKIMPVKRYYPAMRSWAIKCQVFFFFPKSVFPSVAHKLLEMHHNAVCRNCFFILRPTKKLKEH